MPTEPHPPDSTPEKNNNSNINNKYCNEPGASFQFCIGCARFQAGHTPIINIISTYFYMCNPFLTPHQFIILKNDV